MSVDYNALLKEIPRFFCLNPMLATSSEELKEIQCVERSKLVSFFYQCPSFVSINNTDLYKNRKIIPMELSSGLAVLLLDLKRDDDFLDLCCAPGSKLSLAGLIIQFLSSSQENVRLDEIKNMDEIINAHTMSNHQKLLHLQLDQNIGSCTGIDICKHRIAIAKSLVQKYHVPNIRLFQCDARDFCLAPHKNVSISDGGMKYKEIYEAKTDPFSGNVNNSKEDLKAPNCKKSESLDFTHSTHSILPCFASSIYRKSPGILKTRPLYSKVLVDVECTHDGSVKHVIKNGIPTPSNSHLAKLTKMQLEILIHAFSLTKPGGILIYSTCSLMKEQNENVVDTFLNLFYNECKLEDNYTLEKCEFLQKFPLSTDSANDYSYKQSTDSNACSLSQFEHNSATYPDRKYLFFHPAKDKMSGFFLAKIYKL